MKAGFAIDKCPRCGETLRQRSSEQNAMLHALLHDISTQKQWAGQWLDLEDWKRLITAGWCRANNEHVRIFPSIDQQGMEILYRRTSRLSKTEMADLITYAQAWAIDQGIKLSAPEQWAERAA